MPALLHVNDLSVSWSQDEVDTLQKKIRQTSCCKVIAHNSPTTRQALQKCHRFDNVENTENTKGCYYISNLVRERKQRQDHPDDFIDDDGTMILYAEPLFCVARRHHTYQEEAGNSGCLQRHWPF
ncbi:MAG TPA: hypothetical protein VLK82_20665 [Candidatus Tectomicrobia bacterium]|nr:hypothetical protein [Candidatus Tectomicrobia bacterium]